jgi:methionine synthase II (cobalamin-independent)
LIPKFVTTAIGSLPFKEIDSAVELNLSSLDIPCWPQLPKLSFYENMYLQFSEGLPGVVVDEEEKRIYVERDLNEEELLKFLSAVESEDLSYFRISAGYAQGLYALRNKLGDRKLKFLKGQITGPVSFGLSVKFEDGKAIFYEDQWRELLTQHLKMKALWQYSFLKELAEEVIIFIDEPYLSSIGSGYITLSEKEIQSSLSQIIQALKKAGAMTGLHCCGNTDWSKLTSGGLKIDMLNYDAYNYPQSLTVSVQTVSDQLRDGYIAWGIVPSSNQILNLNVQELAHKIEQIFQSLEEKGIEKEELKEKSILTPSCGTASISEESAYQVYRKLNELKEKMLKKV